MRSAFFRIVRAAVVVLALIGGVVAVRNAYLRMESEQAVINAQIIQFRTPISGELTINEIRPGTLLRKGDTLFTIRNPRFGERETSSQLNALQSSVETIENELMGARRDLELASREADRNRRLYNFGAVARETFELSQVRAKSGEALVKQKEAQLARSKERTAEMERQMTLQKVCVVTMPEDGLVWTITGKTGEQMEANRIVLEVINPAHIWVDAFFAEKLAHELKPGLTATIQSLDTNASWTGRLDSIRGGVGRLAYDTAVAVPPPESAKRQIAVRVEPDWTGRFSPAEFYGVGRSVQVRFSRKSERTVGDVLKERVDQALARLNDYPRRFTVTK